MEKNMEGGNGRRGGVGEDREEEAIKGGRMMLKSNEAGQRTLSKRACTLQCACHVWLFKCMPSKCMHGCSDGVPINCLVYLLGWGRSLHRLKNVTLPGNQY